MTFTEGGKIIDWSAAPEGTTHYFDGGQSWCSHWYKSGYFCLVGLESEGWKKNHAPLSISRYESIEDRDKAIYDMLEIVNSKSLKGKGVSAQLGALYDAGYRKV